MLQRPIISLKTGPRPKTWADNLMLSSEDPGPGEGKKNHKSYGAKHLGQFDALMLHIFFPAKNENRLVDFLITPYNVSWLIVKILCVSYA